MKVSTAVIEADDLAVLPRVEVDVSRPNVVLVRWDCTAARVRGIKLKRGETVHVAVTELGRKRIRKAIKLAEATEVFVGESGGCAEHTDIPKAVGLAVMVRRELLRPESLVAEIHEVEYEAEKCVAN